MDGRWDAAVNDLEARVDRPYGPSTLKHPNGTCIASSQSDFLVAAGIEILAALGLVPVTTKEAA